MALSTRPVEVIDFRLPLRVVMETYGSTSKSPVLRPGITAPPSECRSTRMSFCRSFSRTSLDGSTGDTRPVSSQSWGNSSVREVYHAAGYPCRLPSQGHGYQTRPNHQQHLHEIVLTVGVARQKERLHQHSNESPTPRRASS